MIRSLLIVAVAFTAAASADTELPDTPAANRLAAVLDFSARATPGGVAGFIERTFTGDYADRLPLQARIGSFMDWRDRGGFRLVEVLDSDASAVDAQVESAYTGERWRLRVEVDAEHDHRIDGLYLSRMPLPPIDPAPTESEVADRLLDYTASLAERGLFSGAVLVGRHDRILGVGAWGLANRDFDVANDPETRFNLGSMNKTWTAVAIARLVEQGKLSFDDPLSRFIDFPDADAAQRIRIEHLLTHTSGLQSYFTDAFDRKARKTLRTVDDFLALSEDQPLAFDPGTDWRYSNTGMLVLGKVVEIVSGQDYFDYIQEHVLDPAGMSRSGCFELDRVNDNLAVGYAEQWSSEGVEFVNNLFEHVVRGGPAGGCYSTVGDLYRFAVALRNETLIGSDMVETLTTPKPALGSPDYGFGFQVDDGGDVHGHGGGFVGISANLDIIDRPSGWVVVVLANDDGARAPMLKARQLIGVATPDA